MIRKSLIAMLTFLSLVSGSALIISYAKSKGTGGYYYSNASYLFESRGLVITLQRGRLIFRYSYPQENPINPNQDVLRTLRTWVSYLDATSVCPICGKRFRPSEQCPMTNTIFHTLTPNYSNYIPYERHWDVKIVFWGTRRVAWSRWSTLDISLWFAFALFAPYPILAFIRGPLRRWRRRRIGHCVKCGYDLQGNESGICPECGTSIGHRATDGVSTPKSKESA